MAGEKGRQEAGVKHKIMGPRSLARQTKEQTQRNSLEDRGEVRTGRPSQRLVLKQAQVTVPEG